MRLSRRTTSEADAEVLDEPVTTVGKGRATPKRRDAQGRRGPVTAPKTRKEAYARQKQLTREQRTARKTAKPRSIAEQRAALRRGDPSALPRRDQGPTRKLARDYVDSRRMVSNYLLLLFPVMIGAYVVPFAQFVVIGIVFAIAIECFVVGRRIRAMANDRFGSAQGGTWSIGFYSITRAYLPRRFRLPAPQVERGDEI